MERYSIVSILQRKTSKNMEAPKVTKTYSKRRPLVIYDSAATLVPSYPTQQSNVRESRLNDKTLVIDNYNDMFDRILKEEKLRSSTEKSQNENDIMNTEKLQNENDIFSTEKPQNENDKPKEKKRQRNRVAKNKIKKPKQKMKVKKKVLLKGVESLQLKECTVNLNRCSAGYNMINSHELLEVNDKENSLNALRELNKCKDLNTFPQHLKPVENLLSSTPRDRKPRMVVNVQNLSPITLHKENNHILKNRESVALPRAKVKHTNLPNVLKKDSIDNIKNILFNKKTSIEKPRRGSLKLTSNQGNSFENHPEKMYTDQQNKIAEEINEPDKNNCSVSELLDSNKLHNSIENTKSQNERLNSSGQLPIAQQNTNKQSLDQASMMNKKENKSENFIDSPILFESIHSSDLIKISNKKTLENTKIVNSPLQKSNHHKLDEEKVNAKSRIANTVINESSYIPEDWTNDYNSSYEYTLQKGDFSQDKTENKELNKESFNTVKNTTLSENLSSELFESTVNDKQENNLLQENTKQNSKVSDQAAGDNEQINKTDVLSESTSDKNVKSKENKGRKRKLDQTEEYQILNGKENQELNKESLNIVKNTSLGENLSSDLFESTVDDKHENNLLQENINQSSKVSDQAAEDNEQINKTDVLSETTSDKNIESKENKGRKRKLDETEEYEILNDKEPLTHNSKIDENSSKRSKINKKSISKKTKRNTVSDKITAGKVISNIKQITEVSTNNFKTDDINENNQRLVVKIPRIENQNLEIEHLSPQTLENLKKKLQKNTVQTSKRTKIKEPNKAKPTKELNNSELKNLNKSDQKTKRSVSEINKSTADNEDIENSNDNTQDFNLLLSKLKDSTKITTRRKMVKKWDKPLAAITEDQADESLNSLNNKEDRTIEKIRVETQNPRSNKSVNNDFLTEEDEINKLTQDRQSQRIFLKPGKSWARSLSIVNRFHDLNGQNLEELAVGRGTNWRHSVQSVLDMQPEGALHDLSNNDEERDFHSHSLSTRVSVRRETNPFSSVITSPSRVSRFSMRIIPDGKRSTLTTDFVDSQRISTVSNRTRKTSSSRKTSLKIRRDTTLIETEEDLIKSAKDIILKRCKQNSYLPFDVCFPDSYIDNCCKIGEGVYGEVFLHVSDEGKKSVIKIIPIEGDELVNCEPQKKFHEILSEIIIAEELYKLRFGNECNTDGFVGVNRIMCVIGKYPKKLIELWDIYDIKKKSENDRPSMFKDGQLYIIFELAHGGQDLEAFVFQNATESFSIFLQTAFTLAVAEKSLEFEHRDLHWGNILISKTNESETNYKLLDNEFSLRTKGVKVSVIDFTLSRMSYQGCKIFNDLATDPSLFAAQGEYQFEIYRLMRNTVNNDWQQFNPYTNVLWLDYTLDKLITAARYKKKTTKIHKTAIQQMKDLRKEILNYKSAYDFVSSCNLVADIINV